MNCEMGGRGKVESVIRIDSCGWREFPSGRGRPLKVRVEKKIEKDGKRMV